MHSNRAFYHTHTHIIQRSSNGRRFNYIHTTLITLPQLIINCTKFKHVHLLLLQFELSSTPLPKELLIMKTKCYDTTSLCPSTCRCIFQIFFGKCIFNEITRHDDNRIYPQIVTQFHSTYPFKTISH